MNAFTSSPVEPVASISRTTRGLAAPLSRHLGALREHCGKAAALVLPPLVLLAVLIGLWEWAASGPTATLPPPSAV